MNRLPAALLLTGLLACAATAAHAQTAPTEATAEQKQQLQLMEARTGNTSFGAAGGGPYRQLDKAGSAFTVRKFKAMRGQEQERGVSKRVVMGGRTHGEPLVHNHKSGRKHKFLFF